MLNLTRYCLSLCCVWHSKENFFYTDALALLSALKKVVCLSKKLKGAQTHLKVLQKMFSKKQTQFSSKFSAVFRPIQNLSLLKTFFLANIFVRKYKQTQGFIGKQRKYCQDLSVHHKHEMMSKRQKTIGVY